MFTLRCTARLLKRLAIRAAPSSPSPTTRLGDWHANLVHVARQPLVLAVADRTLLPVVVRAAPRDSLLDRMRAAMAVQLGAIGVAPDAIDAEKAAMREVVHAKSANRQVLGILVDFAKALPYHLEARDSLAQAAWKLAETPCGPLYDTPNSSPDLSTAALFDVPEVWRPGWEKALAVKQQAR